MKYLCLSAALLLTTLSSIGQNTNNLKTARPKLVVGIVVDQMRWDYLYRYSARYSADGFKKLLREGYSCENTSINYLPSFTAPGHSGIYTGSVPSITGIAGNNWIDEKTGKYVYCVDDATVRLVGGGDTISGSMSPKNMFTSTITDELRLATNFNARVYGVAIKDRGSILPAGHLANAAYWFDDSTGNFCSSNYYSDPMPVWLKAFNNLRLADALMAQNWELLYNVSTYTQSTADDNKYEKPYKGEKSPVFPHQTSMLKGKAKYNTIKALPAGNTLTLEMAKACSDGERLGRGPSTDFLCVSLSTTDYVGHQFAPNAVEVEDMYLRLDKDIADFIRYLDRTVGEDDYLLFLTADHGAAHNPQYLQDLKMPAGLMKNNLKTTLNAALKAKYGKDSLVSHFENYQIYFNETLISNAKLDRERVKSSAIEFIHKTDGVAYVMDMERPNDAAIPELIKTMAINGYNNKRSGTLQVILQPGWYESDVVTGTTHGTWNPYDTHIPLVWFGWHIAPGATNSVVNMTDISATLAALLHIQMPNGCIGKPIKELTGNSSR